MKKGSVYEENYGIYSAKSLSSNLRVQCVGILEMWRPASFFVNIMSVIGKHFNKPPASICVDSLKIGECRCMDSSLAPQSI